MKVLGLACLVAVTGCAAVAPQAPALRVEPHLAVQDSGTDYARHSSLALQFAAQGRYEPAIRHFRAALALAPQLPHLHNNLGYAYLLGGANAQATQAFEEAVRLDPGYGKARENLRLARLRLALVAPKPAERASTRPDEAQLREVAPYQFELIPARKPRLEVVNANGERGMAKRVAAELGLSAARLSNQRPFTRRSSEIQYRDGYAEAAIELSKRLHGTVRAVRFDAPANGSIDLRLILGRDRLRPA